ncbi:hypothetical protein AAAV00_11905 [Dorea formicigenerans]|uniref:hypothetical protein n=1 Tax=Dorea formicigenerans TaxID=39486 RepID=UPI0032C0ABE5
MDKNTMRETVRMIASDQSVISVVGVTVSRKDTLENYIAVNNEMITVVAGKVSADRVLGRRLLRVDDKRRKIILRRYYRIKV